MARSTEIRTVCTNRRATHQFEVLERFEAGLVLLGTEVKALRDGQAQLTDAYVDFQASRAVARNVEISRYRFDSSGSADNRRPRELLLRRQELRRLAHRVREKGLTAIPLSIYFKGPWAKMEVGLCRGRSGPDKRQVLRRREAEREMDRARRRRP